MTRAGKYIHFVTSFTVTEQQNGKDLNLRVLQSIAKYYRQEEGRHYKMSPVKSVLSDENIEVQDKYWTSLHESGDPAEYKITRKGR